MMQKVEHGSEILFISHVKSLSCSIRCTSGYAESEKWRGRAKRGRMKFFFFSFNNFYRIYEKQSWALLYIIIMPGTVGWCQGISMLFLISRMFLKLCWASLKRFSSKFEEVCCKSSCKKINFVKNLWKLPPLAPTHIHKKDIIISILLKQPWMNTKTKDWKPPSHLLKHFMIMM